MPTDARQAANRLRIPDKETKMKEVHDILEILILVAQLVLSTLRLYEEARKMKPPRR
jgi:hypothetical protein